MEGGDPEKFIAVTYSVWSTAKTIALYSALIYLGQKRYDEIDGLYNSKDVCQSCYDQAVMNPSEVFEYGRCDKSFDVPSDKSNLLKSDSSWSLTVEVSQVKDYVATPAVCLAIAGFCWISIVALNCMMRAPRFLTVLLAFVFNYLFGLMLVICTGMIYNLYLKDFGGDTRCYVQVVGQPFMNAIGILSIIWAVAVIAHHCCMRESNNHRASLIFLGLTQLVVIALLALYTAKAAYATEKGLANAAVFTILGWQMITEVPALAFLCKTLFDLSTALSTWGILPHGMASEPEIDTGAVESGMGIGSSIGPGGASVSGTPQATERAGLLAGQPRRHFE